MSLPSYYYELYSQICSTDDIPFGSGICVDGYNIITCAHVVNAALQRNVCSLEFPRETVKIILPQNENVANQVYHAKIVTWGWTHPFIKCLAPTQFDYEAQLMKYDFAILYIDMPEKQHAALYEYSKNLRFLKGNLLKSNFEALSFNPANGAQINYVIGTFGIEDKKYGSTIIHPDENPKSFFFDYGSSGSPVIASAKLSDGSSVLGLGGIVDFLNSSSKTASVDARLLSCKNIESLMSYFCPEIRLKFVNLDEKEKLIQQIHFAGKIIEERGSTGKEILCNRATQLSTVKLTKLKSEKKENVFFIYGKERQKLDAFVDRYRYEFIASQGTHSNLVFFKMPKDKDKGLFCNSFIGNILRFFSMPNIDNIDAQQTSIRDLVEELKLPEGIDVVFDCKIEHEDVEEEHKELFNWVFEYFLHPLIYNSDGSLSNIHFFISYYSVTNEIDTTDKHLFKIKPEINSLQVFQNVVRQDLVDWLDFVEGRDLERKNKILKGYPLKSDYEMAEIIELYKKATYALDKF